MKVSQSMNSDRNSKESKYEVGGEYGKDYLTWKSWGDQEFGKLRGTDERYFSAEIKRSRTAIDKNAKVLEIGFGNGSFLTYAQKQGWSVCGTEINSDLVELAVRFGYSAIHTCDLATFSDNAFNLIVAFDVLEHIPQDDLLGFLAEIKRILKDQGVFIARFPNGDSPFGLRNQNGDITHVTAIGSSKARQLATKVNMDVVFVGGEAQPIIGVSPQHSIHRIVSLPIKKMIDVFVNAVFLPRANVAFCSSNLTMIYMANKPAQP